MTDLARQQAIRLSNTLLAAAGGLVLTLALIIGALQGYLVLPAAGLTVALIVFWLVNSAFIIAIKSGFNLRFSDPALSLPQMYWATTCAMGAIAISTHLDLVLYLMTLITVVFGIFRATERQFNVLCVYVVIFLLLMHWLRALWAPDTLSWNALLHWLVFSFCAITLTRLCQAIVKLRNRLREQNQELKEALQAKSYFLANMSHEIRTPMNGVIGMLDLALHTELPTEARRYLGIAQSSANALVAIINDILDFSTMEAGKLRIESVDFDLEQLVNEVIVTFSAKAEAKNLELILDIAPETPLHVRADPVRLRQILNNLVANALKFTESGEIVVAVEPQQRQDTLELLCSVKDSGIGIAEEKQQELFFSFTQADSSTTRLYGGTGLGLAICKQLCQLMGGTIGVESEVGNGSRFFFTLPVERAEATADAREPLDLNALLEKNVLVVDDNATNRLVLRKQLEYQGARVTEAEDAEQALALLADGTAVDIALIDLQMPKVDGVMLAQRIRALEGRGPVAIVLLSSGLQDLEPGLLRTLDISASLYKPVPPQRLLRAIASALHKCATHVPGAGDTDCEAQLQAGPRDSQGGSTPAARATQSPARALPGSQEARLLLVEDNSINRDVAEVALETLGYGVDMAVNGQDAVDRVMHAWQQGQPYRLVLMDCQMPVLDGYRATERIRQWEQESGSTPVIIIAMTANAMEGDRSKCLAAGMNDYLSKPVQLEVLQRKLNQWLLASADGQMKASESCPPVRPSSTLVWEASRLLKLVRHKEERMIKLLQSFLAGLDTVEKEIVQALHTGNRDFARRQIHGLKGSSANLGAGALPAYLGDLDRRLAENVPVNVEHEVLALQSHLVRLRGAMQSYLDVSFHPSA